jgi:hypothetical protein
MTISKSDKAFLKKVYRPLHPPPPLINDEKSFIRGYSSFLRRRNLKNEYFWHTVSRRESEI